jgi:hypothetical protein
VSEEKTILRHSCRSKGGWQYTADEFEVGRLYFPINDERTRFCVIPTVCKCRKKITLTEAQQTVAAGRAHYLCKLKDGKQIILNGVSEKEVEHLHHAIGLCEAIAIFVVRSRTPRVDMITKADMQRAIFGSSDPLRGYKYDPKIQRYVALYQDFIHEDDAKDRRIRKQFQTYIKESWKLAMETRRTFFRGLELKDGKIVGGEEIFVNPQDELNDRGRPLFWFE